MSAAISALSAFSSALKRAPAVERRARHEVSDLLEAEAELLVEEHLLQALEILRCVQPVAGLRAPGRAQQPELVVVAERAHADVREPRHRADSVRGRERLHADSVDPHVA
jgi:hypothetical protein